MVLALLQHFDICKQAIWQSSVIPFHVICTVGCKKAKKKKKKRQTNRQDVAQAH